MDFLPKKLDEYVCNHTQEENLVLAELNRETGQKSLFLECSQVIFKVVL